MSELPNGWKASPLAALLASDSLFSDGDWIESKDQDPNGSIRLLQLADIGDGNFIDKSNRFINEAKFETLRCTELFENDVLIARMPDPLGRACLMPKLRQRCITVVDVAVFRTGIEGVANKWLMRTINSPQLRAEIELKSSGTTRKRISRGNLAAMELPIPPLAEQKRIADKLDAVLARVDACRDRLDRIPTLLKRFRQSILAAATSGRLTEDWRNSRDLQLHDFPEVEFGALLTGIRSGSSEVPSDQISPFPVLRSSSVRQGKIDYADIKYLAAAQSGNKKDFLENGDVLFTRLNGTAEYVGNCAVVENIEPATYQYPDRLFRATLAQSVLPKYCVIAFSSPKTRQEIETRAKSTAGHKRVSIQDIKEIKIPLPGIGEQHEIIRRVEILFAFADRLEARLATARKQVGQLTPALLAKAFRGELVPQDPNDEPAAELLKRLAAAPKAMRGRKTKVA